VVRTLFLEIGLADMSGQRAAGRMRKITRLNDICHSYTTAANGSIDIS